MVVVVKVRIRYSCKKEYRPSSVEGHSGQTTRIETRDEVSPVDNVSRVPGDSRGRGPILRVKRSKWG